MKKFTLFLILIVASLAAGSLSIASAQSSVDATLLSFVQTAFKNTSAATSLEVDVNALSSNLAAGKTTATPTLQRTSSFQLMSDGNGGWNITGHQTFGPPVPANATPEANATDNNTTLEMVVLGGKTYIRYTEIPPRMTPQNPPPNWTDTASLPAGTAFAGGTPTAKDILTLLSVPLDATSVTSLNEQAADTIDGMAMRVFQITLDTQKVMDSDAAGVLNTGLARPTGAAAPPPATVSPAATPQATPVPMSPDNTGITLTVWIGTDNLVHRITSVVIRSQMGAKADTTTTLTNTTDFTNFNQPVTISAPAIGS